MYLPINRMKTILFSISYVYRRVFNNISSHSKREKYARDIYLENDKKGADIEVVVVIVPSTYMGYNVHITSLV